MKPQAKTKTQLLSENAELSARLAEAEETLQAIRSGEVDALLVTRPDGDQIFTLQGAETTYRFLVEEMNEGALLLAPEGTVLYANARFAHLADVSLEQVTGSPWERFFVAADQPRLAGLLAGAKTGSLRGEFLLGGGSGFGRPVSVSLRSMHREQVEGFCVVVADLTERKAIEAALREANDKLELRVEQRTAQLTRANDLLLAEMGERKRTEAELVRQREWLRVTLTSIGDAVIACDYDCRVTFINPAAAALTGWRVEEARGQAVTNVFRIINEQTRQSADDIMARVLREQRVLGLANHTVLVCRDGREIPVEDSAAPILDGAGKAMGVVLVFHDVTQTRRAQEALQRSQERLLLAQKAGRVGVFDWDLITNQMVWTPELEAIFGLPPGGFENRYEAWAARVHPEDLPRLEQLLREWLNSDRETAEWEHRYLRQGEPRWIASRGQAFRDPAGKPLRIIGTNVDVTERKREEAILSGNREALERLVVERTAKLQEMLNELEHFSYTITHDMRAPLRAMQGFAGLMAELCGDCPNIQNQEYLGLIKASAVRMDRLITDALQYSQVVQQHLPLEPVDATTLLRGIIESYPDLQPPKARIRMEGEIPPVIGNEAGLTQCFSNLLGNAVKFMPPGRVPEVRIWAERKEVQSLKADVQSPEPALAEAAQPPLSGAGRVPPITPPLHRSITPPLHHATTPLPTVRLWFEDNGIGIPKEAQQKIFQMFQRATTAYEGTGIGLALVRKVAERMGGTVGVESEEGCGSRFWLELTAAS